MLRTWRVPLVVLVGVSAALGPAGRASAEVSVTVDGGTSFASGRTVLVRYRGATPNGQLYLSQCWQGDGPTFDVATVCSTFNQTLGVTSAAEGDLDFDVFSGEEPSGSGVSCGPSTKESVKAYTTCYLRVAPDALDNTTGDVFVALDFSTAKPSDGAVINGTSVPASTTSSIAVTVDDPSTDVAGSSPAPDASAAPADTPVGAAAPTTGDGSPTAAGAGAVAPRDKGTGAQWYIVPIGAMLVWFGAVVFYQRRHRIASAGGPPATSDEDTDAHPS